VESIRLAESLDDGPAVERVVEELARRVAGIALLHGAREGILVARLHQRDRLLRVREIQHHHVHFRTERGLEIVLPVEPLLLQLLFDRVDRLLLVRELVRQGVHVLPLRRAEVRVDRNEQRH
jgi:hypothetical protein